MTLVMYIPCNNGCIMMADRQSTEGTMRDPVGTCKREVEKLYLVGENGPAIGCAGYTEIMETLFAKIKEKTEINCKNVTHELEKLIPEVAEQWKVTYREYRELVSPLENFELFIVTHNGAEIIPYRFHGTLCAPVEKARCHGIGGGFLASGSLLNWGTNDLPERGAIKWGAKVLQQVAILNYGVGAPEYHGYDVIGVSNQGKFTKYFEGPSVPKTIDVVSLLKEFGKIELVEGEG